MQRQMLQRLWVTLILSCAPVMLGAAEHWTTPSNVIWTTPSQDAAGSMPLGNGEVGINLWVEEDGDLPLLPAWPKDWDVSFKLHAPKNTTLECVYQGGKIKRLIVTPKNRLADVKF